MAGRVALKIDVDTLRGTLEGVPALLDLLTRHRLDASFLFSLGPDNTGRALRRILRPGFVRKVWRTSVGTNYGLKTLCYGTLLPAPDIGVRANRQMRAVHDAGFETGVHCYDHVLWQDHVADRDYAWTRLQMELAIDAFERIFGERPQVHGAAGWQMNEHVPALEAQLGFRYASDTRGSTPFVPPVRGTQPPCPQLPTTLPTFDELIGLDGCTTANVADVLLDRSLRPAPLGHVFTLHAEIEGGKLLPLFERLLRSWLERGMQPCSMRELYRRLPGKLPECPVTLAEIPGRTGSLACQGAPLPSMDPAHALAH